MAVALFVVIFVVIVAEILVPVIAAVGKKHTRVVDSSKLFSMLIASPSDCGRLPLTLIWFIGFFSLIG